MIKLRVLVNVPVLATRNTNPIEITHKEFEVLFRSTDEELRLSHVEFSDTLIIILLEEYASYWLLRNLNLPGHYYVHHNMTRRISTANYKL